MLSNSCKSSFLVIAVIKSHDDASVLSNTSLSSVTKEFHDKEAVN